MAQVFHRSTNFLSKLSLFGAAFFLVAIGWVLFVWYRSSWVTGATIPPEQPVPFSHEHHVRGLGIDCRYCHTSAEDGSFAGIPAVHTCMTCHSRIWSEAPILEPVRESYRTGAPLRWNRVHDLPEFVFFHHGIHVRQGFGCTTCHGRIDAMPLVWQSASLHMTWCLDCHREPERFIRPRGEIYNLEWETPPDQIRRGEALVREYGIDKRRLTDCILCHR